MILVVLEIEDRDFEDIQKRLRGLGPLIKAVFKKPVAYCKPETHGSSTKKSRGFARGRKFGWWVCSQCFKPTKAWGNNINAVISSSTNLGKPCDCMGPDCGACCGTGILYTTGERNEFGMA